MTAPSNSLGINMFVHCSMCLDEWKAGEAPGQSPASYSRLSVGFTAVGVQVWCMRHEANVCHIDFQGHKHPANTTAQVEERRWAPGQ